MSAIIKMEFNVQGKCDLGNKTKNKIICTRILNEGPCNLCITTKRALFLKKIYYDTVFKEWLSGNIGQCARKM